MSSFHRLCCCLKKSHLLSLQQSKQIIVNSITKSKPNRFKLETPLLVLVYCFFFRHQHLAVWRCVFLCAGYCIYNELYDYEVAVLKCHYNSPRILGFPKECVEEKAEGEDEHPMIPTEEERHRDREEELDVGQRLSEIQGVWTLETPRSQHPPSTEDNEKDETVRWIEWLAQRGPWRLHQGYWVAWRTNRLNTSTLGTYFRSQLFKRKHMQWKIHANPYMELVCTWMECFIPKVTSYNHFPFTTAERNPLLTEEIIFHVGPMKSSKGTGASQKLVKTVAKKFPWANFPGLTSGKF